MKLFRHILIANILLGFSDYCKLVIANKNPWFPLNSCIECLANIPFIIMTEKEFPFLDSHYFDKLWCPWHNKPEVNGATLLLLDWVASVLGVLLFPFEQYLIAYYLNEHTFDILFGQFSSYSSQSKVKCFTRLEVLAGLNTLILFCFIFKSRIFLSFRANPILSVLWFVIHGLRHWRMNVISTIQKQLEGEADALHEYNFRFFKYKTITSFGILLFVLAWRPNSIYDLRSLACIVSATAIFNVCRFYHEDLVSKHHYKAELALFYISKPLSVICCLWRAINLGAEAFDDWVGDPHRSVLCLVLCCVQVIWRALAFSIIRMWRPTRKFRPASMWSKNASDLMP